MNNPELTPTARLDQIGEEVRSGLKFDHALGEVVPPNRGNCYDFALRTYDKIKSIPSNDYIGYTFNHAFNVGVDEDNKLYLASSDLPGLTAHEADHPVAGGIVPRENIGRVRSGTIIDSIPSTFNMAAIASPLTAENMETIGDANKWFPKYWLKPGFPNGSIMEASYARDALANYLSFRKGLKRHDFEVIRDSLEELRIRSPQNETRPRYNEELRNFGKVIRRMAQGAVASSVDLHSLVENYSDILPEKNSAANVLFGDCFKTIGKHMGDDSSMVKARGFYKEAGRYARSRKGREFVEAKISKIDGKAGIATS